jgi:preprotein translocase subunit YajC
MTPDFILAMATPAQGAPSAWVQFLPFVLVLAIFYFLIMRPMRRKQLKVQEGLAALKVGDKVVTKGGIHGTITKVHESSLQLEIADRVRIEISRTAVEGPQGEEPWGS